MAVEFICDEFRRLGLHTNKIADNDLAVTFYAKSPNCEVEMRIDRLTQQFQLSAQQNGYTYMPIEGDWDQIVGCLKQLSRSITIGKKA